MNLAKIAAARIKNQQIENSKIKTTAELVYWFGAVQAQEYSQSKWALGLRLPHLKDSDIEKDFNSGKILRTHLLRPTWHFVAAEDIRWLLDLTAPRVQAVNACMYKKSGLDLATFSRCNKLITKVLEGRKYLTRDEINTVFKQNKITASGHRLSYIMMNAELSGLICSGPKKGNQFTYALLEERAPKAKKLNKEEALAELAQRYFLSRGPATIKDFSTWSGLTKADCLKGLQANGKFFQKETVDGVEYFYKSGLDATPIYNMYMLPVYDEMIMGYKDRNAIFEFKNANAAKTDFTYDNMIIYGGQIIGTWRRVIGKKTIELYLQFFRPLNTKQEQTLAAAVKQYECFNETSVKIITADLA